eukprot:1146793-Pelagomonas_calceolata.AAC.8
MACGTRLLSVSYVILTKGLQWQFQAMCAHRAGTPSQHGADYLRNRFHTFLSRLWCTAPPLHGQVHKPGGGDPLNYQNPHAPPDDGGLGGLASLGQPLSSPPGTFVPLDNMQRSGTAGAFDKRAE